MQIPSKQFQHDGATSNNSAFASIKYFQGQRQRTKAKLKMLYFQNYFLGKKSKFEL